MRLRVNFSLRWKTLWGTLGIQKVSGPYLIDDCYINYGNIKYIHVLKMTTRCVERSIFDEFAESWNDCECVL